MLNWLLTYLVHSTVLLGMAALVCLLLDNRRLSVQEALWRLAVIGAVVTTSVQLALAVQPLGGTFNLRSSSPISSSEIASLVNPAIPTPETVGAFSAGSAQSSLLYSILDPWLVLFWIVGAGSLAATLVFAYLRLEGRLRDRRRIEGGPLPKTLAGLLTDSESHRKVALSSSRQIAVPLAKGWWKREICLPERTLRQMSAEKLETILAHELAHLERRDPLWLGALHLLESVLFIQPLNRLARRRLQEIAEYRCDDWAVNRTGQPLTLAQCLADVAEWTLRQDQRILTPTLASRGRFLSRRVARLLDRGSPPADSSRPLWLVPLALALLLLTVIAMPGFSLAQPEEPPPPPEPVVEAAPAPPVPPVAATEPTSPVAPVPAVPALDTVPLAPLEPVAPESVQMRLDLEIEQRVVAERLAIQVRDLERVKRVELERLEKIHEETAETLDLELNAVAELRRIEEVELRTLRQELRVERERLERLERLHRDELRELSEEHLRIQRERQEISAPEAPDDDPPS